MPLVTANQYDLVPQFSNLGTGFAQGQQIANQFKQGKIQDQQLASEQAKQQTISQFSPQALQGDPAALEKVAAVDPGRAIDLQKIFANKTEAEIAEDLRENKVLTQTALNAMQLPPEKRRAFLLQKREEFKANGRDTSNTDRALAADDATMNQMIEMQAMQGLALDEQAARAFPDLVKGRQLDATNRSLDIRERELEQRRELAFAQAEIAGQTETKKLEAQIELKPVLEGKMAKAEGDVKSAGKVIDQSFERISKVQSNISNMDRAISALDRGAKTGAIQKFLPSITAASRELKQIQNELGLDVIGSVTFGALSEGELNLALDTALDLGQDPEALKNLLTQKKAAQEKLIGYLNKQIQFLDSGGTLAQWSQKVNSDIGATSEVNIDDLVNKYAN